MTAIQRIQSKKLADLILSNFFDNLQFGQLLLLRQTHQIRGLYNQILLLQILGTMVDSVSFKAKLVDFTGLDSDDKEQINLCNSAFNSFIVRIDDLAKYKEVQQFTRCEDCKMVLTQNDYDFIDDWNLISQNQKQFADIPEKIKVMRDDPWAYYIWQCRFCAHKNLISKDKAYFAQNKSKVIIRDGIPKQLNKHYCESPLLLFLIDSSSSMEESISEQSDSKKMKDSLQMVKQTLKKTKVYQRLVQNQQNRLKNIRKLCTEEMQNVEYRDFLTKNKVLMSLLQHSIKDIKDIFKQLTDKKKGTDIYHGSSNFQRKVGFIFFNSDVIIHKESTITVSEKTFDKDHGTMFNPRVDFDNFRELFELGIKQSDKFGTEFSNFSFDEINIDQNLINPSGQTALGPALTIASGIVSNFGPGSLVVVITDGRANKGIFREDHLFSNQMNLLNMKFEKAKAEVCLIELEQKKQEMNPKEEEIESSLSKYFRKYCQRIIIQLDSRETFLQVFRTRLRDVISRTKDKNVINEFIVKCQNKNVDYESSIKNYKKKLFNTKSQEFTAPKINTDILKAIDYKFPFMTQILIRYQDIQTKQEQFCLTYMIQKIIKYKEMSKKDREVINAPETLMNVLNYFNKEEQKLDLQNIPLSISQLSFKSMIQATMTMSINREHKMNLMRDFDESCLKQEEQQAKSPQSAKQMIKRYQICDKNEEDNML